MKYDWLYIRGVFFVFFSFKSKKNLTFDFIDILKSGIIPSNCISLFETFQAS